jgi:hypothetical protein
MRLKMDTLTMSLCDTTARLFVLGAKKGLCSVRFIERFMNSKTCANFDLPYDRLQWAGEQYILAELLDETDIPQGETFDDDTLYWIGYTYRYWHLYSGESSQEIYAQANAETMNMIYPGYHTLDVPMAIDRIKEANDMRVGNLRCVYPELPT